MRYTIIINHEGTKMKRFILATGILFLVVTMFASCGDEQQGERLNDVSLECI
jgi:phosphate starvation-inducible membrane PsiE